MASPQHYRTFTLRKADIRSAEDGSVIRIAISSEKPYLRFIEDLDITAYEVLGHKAEEVDMTYMTEGAPLFYDHQMCDQRGVLENVTLDPDGVMRADVRFSNRQDGQDLLDDMKNGIRPRISVGYNVTKYENVGIADDGNPIVRAVRWQPYEASSVPIPADLSVGVGRAKKDDVLDSLANLVADKLAQADDEEKADEDVEALPDEAPEAVAEAEEKADDDLTDEEVEEIKANIETRLDQNDDPDEDASEDEDTEDEETESEDERKKGLFISKTKQSAQKAAKLETKQMSEATNGSAGADKDVAKRDLEKITNLAVKHGMTDKLASWVAEGRSYESVAGEILEANSNVKSVSAPTLSTKEHKSMSVVGGLQSLVRGDNSLINEIGKEVATRNGLAVKGNGLYIPLNVPLFKSKRTYTTANNAGGSIVANEYLTFEQALYEYSIIGTLGIQVMETVTNQLKMPRLDGVSGAWAAEEGTINETSSSFATVTWSPKTYNITVPFTNQIAALDGTYSVEDITRQDILNKFAEVFEYGIIAGSGTSNQPTGVAYDTLLGEPALAGSGSLYSSFTKMISTQANNKGSQNNTYFVMTPDLYAAGLGNPKFTNGSIGIIGENGTLAGRPVVQTGHLPTSGYLSGSACGAVLYGNFSSVLAAHFGVVELLVDPYTGANTGVTKIHGSLMMDSHARQPKDLVRRAFDPLK